MQLEVGNTFTAMCAIRHLLEKHKVPIILVPVYRIVNAVGM